MQDPGEGQSREGGEVVAEIGGETLPRGQDAEASHGDRETQRIRQLHTPRRLWNSRSKEQYGKKGRKDVTCAKKMILLQATMKVRTCGGSKVVPFNRGEQSESEEEAVVVPSGEIDIPKEDDSKKNQ